MFDNFRAYWYYNKLGSAHGVSFEHAAMSLSSIKNEDSARYLLDILVSRSDLTIEEKSHLARAFSSIGKVASRYLLNQIFDQNGDIQYNVVTALGEIGETDAVATFCFLFEKTDNPIFASALADIGDPAAIPVLRNKITGNSIARLESLEALFKIAPHAEAPFLVSLLYSPHMIIRKHAVRMLSTISYRFEISNEQNLYNALRSDWEKIVIESGTLSLFCHFVNDEDTEFKKSLVTFLIKTDCLETRRVLYEFLSDTDEDFLAFLLTHLKNAHIERFEILDNLFTLLMHDSVIVRHLAEELFLNYGSNALPDLITEISDSKNRSLLYQTTLQTLCISVGQNNLATLYHALQDADDYAKQMIINIIGEVVCPEYSDLVVQFLITKDSAVKSGIVRTIGETGTEREIALFQALIPDQITPVRMALYNALAQMAARIGITVVIEPFEMDDKEMVYVQKLFGDDSLKHKN